MAVTGQFAIARDASYTWTPAASGEAQNTVGFRDVAYRHYRMKYLTVPTGYKMGRWTMGIEMFECVLGSMFDKSGATPPTPATTAGIASTDPGTLVITLASGKTRTVKGFMHQLDHTSQGGSVGPEQNYQWGFVGSAESSSDAVTVA